MAMPLLVQVSHKILQDGVARQHHPLLHLLLRDVALGPIMMLVGIRLTTANLTQMLVGIVVVIGLTATLRHLPQRLSQQRIAVPGMTKMCVPMVVNTALPTIATARLVAVTGCLEVPLRC
jgi:hypothetical protein